MPRRGFETSLTADVLEPGLACTGLVSLARPAYLLFSHAKKVLQFWWYLYTKMNKEPKGLQAARWRQRKYESYAAMASPPTSSPVRKSLRPAGIQDRAIGKVLAVGMRRRPRAGQLQPNHHWEQNWGRPQATYPVGERHRVSVGRASG